MAIPYKLIDFVTIRFKKIISINDGTEKALDFAEPIIEDKYPLKYSGAPIIVSEELAGKPTSISKIRYDDGSYGDLLCYYNDISNPLMLPEGYILFTPELESMLLNTVDKNNDKSKNKSKKNLNKKLSQKDKNRIQSLINRAKNAGIAIAGGTGGTGTGGTGTGGTGTGGENAGNIGGDGNIQVDESGNVLTGSDASQIGDNTNGSDTNFSTPNMADENVPDAVASNGKITLGNNVTNTRCSQELSTTQTKSEAIKKAIKAEIIGK
jgi:hypothetical protein